MISPARLRAEALVAMRSFLRRRTAVFFTFGFPLLLVGIFGVVVQSGTSGSGLLSRPPGYYLAGYLSFVVVFTPLTRIGTSIARYRAGRSFEKLGTTPLLPIEWLLAHTTVNALVILAASVPLVLVLGPVAGASVSLSPLLVPFVVAAVVVFCGLGAILGRLASSQDGVVAASNAVALPVVFLSETFVPSDRLPEFVRPLVALSPLTYFARGVRNVTYAHSPVGLDLFVLTVFAIPLFLLGAFLLPQQQ